MQQQLISRTFFIGILAICSGGALAQRPTTQYFYDATATCTPRSTASTASRRSNTTP